MSVHNRKEALLLLIGDIVLLFASIWLSLLLRHFEVPAWDIFLDHVSPFSIVFLIWIFLFFVSGLYESHTLIFKNKLPSLLFRVQITNSFVAVLFFYLIPYFGITPKTILFVYLAVSFVLMLAWRLVAFNWLFSPEKQNALIIGEGKELKELYEEINQNPRYSIKFISSVDTDELETIDFQKEIIERVYSENVAMVAVDLKNEKVAPLVPHMYNLIFSGVHFVDMHKLYEDIFNRVPLSLVRYSWFLENISHTPKSLYDFLKRLMDIVISIPLAIVPIICLPFIWVLNKFESKGPLFIYQERIGSNNAKIRILKFRSMLFDDRGENGTEKNKVTKVGAFLRNTRLDEFPQLWNVIKGDLSLIGPRPELPALVREYENNVPFYNIRHLIKPGLSGWAQLYHENHPHHNTDVSETKVKLSYDLYYIKNRSFFLDLKIALHTIGVLFSRKGR